MLPRQPPSSFFRTAGLLLALALPAASCRIFRGKPPPPPPPPPPRVIRPDRVPPLTGFEQLAGWTVESPRATVRLDKEAEGALWGSFAARVTAEPLETGLHAVTITPARNLVVNSVFNTVLVWVREETPGLLRPDHRIVLSVRDAAGVRRDIAMPYQPQAGWQMLHLRLGESPPWPLTVEHLRWEFPVGDPASPPRVLWLDSLACYQEILTRIPQDTLYARPFGYAPSHARTGTGNVTLDFPASPLAFLPASTSPRQSLAVESGRDRQFVLRSEAEDGLLEYLVDAEEDGPRLSVRWNGREWPGLWSGLRVETAGAPLSYRLARKQDNAVLMQYSDGVRFRFTLEGNSLVLETDSVGGDVAALDLGRLGADPALEGRPVYFPLMNVGEAQPWPILRFGRGAEQLFVSCFPDWWFSLAGLHQAGASPAATGESLGRMVYPLRWRGGRNVFRERVYLTVSPRVDAVLPSSGLRPEWYRQSGGMDFLWSGIWPLGDTPPPRARPGLAAAWSGESIAPAGTWPTVWRDQGALAAPLPILTHLHPLDEDWRDPYLARDPEGGWVGHPAGGFTLKPARFPDLSVQRVTALRDQQDPGFLPLMEITRHSPWRFTDYDARVLGAGTYAQTFAELGVLLQQAAAEIGGPVLGPGGAEWLYAGLVAGLIPEPTLGFQQTHPFLPLFALRHVQPLSALMGMGPLASYRIGGETVGEAELLDRCLATQIAYAACGRLPMAEDPRLLRRAARLLAPLHRLLDAEHFVQVAYWDGERLLDSSQALATEAIARSQIYLRGAGGTEIWVNGDFEEDWSLRVGHQTWVLPPFGFYVQGEGLQATHARDPAGHRFYGLRDAGGVWLDSPDGPAHFAGLGLAGAASYQIPAEGRGPRLDVEDFASEIRLARRLPGLAGLSTVEAFDGEGLALPGVTWQAGATEGILRAAPTLRTAIFLP